MELQSPAESSVFVGCRCLPDSYPSLQISKTDSHPEVIASFHLRRLRWLAVSAHPGRKELIKSRELPETSTHHLNVGELDFPSGFLSIVSRPMIKSVSRTEADLVLSARLSVCVLISLNSQVTTAPTMKRFSSVLTTGKVL